MNIRQRILLTVSVSLFATSASAAPFVLTFEGLGVRQTLPGLPEGVVEGVGEFYNGGFGADGSGPGPNLGVIFSENALAIQDADATGLGQGSGNFGGEPSPDTVLFFLTGSAATMTVPAGFEDGFSFYYSSYQFVGSIVVYSGEGGTGDVLASLTLPTTPYNGEPDPTGEFSPFVPIGIRFDGVARSIDFGGSINQIGFDNVTFGSDVPVPEPGTALLVSYGLSVLAVARRRAPEGKERTKRGRSPLAARRF